MKQASISLITPVYNGMPFLKECLESVFAQEFQDWEILISDDGSSDESRAYLDTLADPRIKLFKQEKNLGIFGNLNFLFSHAQAPISQILCQDDYFISPTSLSTIVNYWQKAPAHVGFVRYNHSNTARCRAEVLQHRITPTVIHPDQSDRWFFVFGNIPGNLSNVSLRTNLVAHVGGFNQEFPYAGDFDFWTRAARQVSMGVEPENITYVRRHPGVASNFLNRKGELLEQKVIIVNTIYQSLIDQFPDDEVFFKLQGTLNYDSLQRDVAIRRMLRKDTRYMKELERVTKNAHYVFSKKYQWSLFFLSLGGRIGREIVANKIISDALSIRARLPKHLQVANALIKLSGTPNLMTN